MEQLWQVEYQDGSIEYIDVTVLKENNRTLYITEDYIINATSLDNAVLEFGNESPHARSIVVFQKVVEHSLWDK